MQWKSNITALGLFICSVLPSHLSDNTNTAVREVHKELEKEEKLNESCFFFTDRNN